MVDKTTVRSEVADAAVSVLRPVFRGEIIVPEDPQYEAARHVWNGTVERMPGAIVRPTGPADVIAAVNFARERDLLVAVRCGGHSTPGHSTCDEGIVIDLSAMRGVRVDPAAKTAHVGGGSLLGDVDHETMPFGLATTTGTVSHTGVAGLTLGGGFGRLQRKFGLAVDNLLSVDIVTADGRLLHASEKENADLFWGIRGAGSNFGIVTSFEFRLHPVHPMINFGLNVFEREQAQEVLAAVREFCAQAPDEALSLIAFLTVAPQPPFPPELYGKAVLLVGVNHCGTAEDAENDLKPLREIGSPLFQLYAPVPYVMAQSMQDVFYEAGRRSYAKGGYLGDLTPEIGEVLLKRAAAARGHDQIGLFQMGGAVGRVAEDAMAFSGRNSAFFVAAEGTWDDPAEDEQHMSWGRETVKALEPFLSSGNYVNALTGEADESVRAAYGDAKYERLVALKNKYDPTNLFRLNTNIKPTTS